MLKSLQFAMLRQHISGDFSRKSRTHYSINKNWWNKLDTPLVELYVETLIEQKSLISMRLPLIIPFNIVKITNL